MGNDLLAQTTYPEHNSEHALTKQNPRDDASPLLRQIQAEQAFNAQRRPEPDAVDLTLEGVYSAVYSGFQAPVKALGQVADNLIEKAGAHTDIAKAVSVLPEPTHEAAGSARANAQLCGSAVGLTVPFFATKGALNRTGLSFAAKAETTMVGAGRFIMPTRTALIADSAVTGFTSEFLLRPTDNAPEFWKARGKNGLVGAATYATLTATSMAARSLASPVLENTTGVKRLAAEFVTGAASGAPAGVVNADAHSLLNEGRFATNQERHDSATIMAVFGGVMNTAPRIIGFHKTVNAIESTRDMKFDFPDPNVRAENLRRIMEDSLRRRPPGTSSAEATANGHSLTALDAAGKPTIFDTAGKTKFDPALFDRVRVLQPDINAALSRLGPGGTH